MSIISFGGLATGLDTGAIVSQLLEIRKAPIYRLQSRIENYNAQKTALHDLKSKLEKLQTAAAAVQTPTSFAALSATSSQEGLLTASAGGSASPGTYQIHVDGLAAAQKDISQGYASLADTIGSGSVSFTVNGETTQVDLAGPTSLSSFVDAVNDAGVGVFASVLNDGSDGTPYRLILTSAEAGVDNTFTVDLSGLVGGVQPTMTNLTPAADASLRIDGIAVTASTNSITDAISGLTFDLVKVDPDTPVTVTVDTDATTVSENVQALVDAYNDLMTYIGAKGGDEGVLNGHSALRTVKSQIQSIFAYPLTTGTGDITLMSQVGIELQSDGTVSFDKTKFADMVADSYSGVRDLFVERNGNIGKASLIDTAVENLTDSVDGIFKISEKALTSRIDYADDSILRYQRSVDAYEIYLNRKFSAMESAVSALQAQGNYLMSQFS